MSSETKKDAIEELKIVQDILLKQEAYSLAVFKYSFVIIVGLMVAYLTDKICIDKSLFTFFVSLAFFGFAYVQVTYREAFYRGLERSRYLQRVIGNREKNDDADYVIFHIYESFNEPHLRATCKNIWKDIKNPRFIVPNFLLYMLSLVAIWL